MVPTLKIDTSRFNAAMQSISKYSGVPLEAVVEFESGKVLEAAVRGTRAAAVSKIRAAMDSQECGYFDVGNGRKRYYLGNHYPDEIWHKIEAARKASLKRKLAARGLAKQSWLALAQAYGLQIGVPNFVRDAVPRTGKQYDNATARAVRRRGSFGIYFENRQPTVRFAGGRAALLRAINGRTRYFRKLLQMGVFKDLKAIARAYPGMKIK